MFATNGEVVMRSADGGCNWEQKFSLPTLPSAGLPFTSAESEIEQVVTSRSLQTPGTVFVTIDQLEPVSRPHVLVSNDAGNSWQLGDRGLETAIGRPEALVSSPSNSGIVYLLTDTSAVEDVVEGSAVGIAQTLYMSADRGMTWSRREVFTGNPWDGVEVDPLLPEELWFYGDGGLGHKKGDEPVSQPQGVSGAIAAVDVFHERSAPARILAFSALGPAAFVSQDGGRTFTAFGAPGVVQSAASFASDIVVVASNAGVFLSFPGGVVDVSPGDAQIVDVQTSGMPGFVVYGRTGTTLEIGDLKIPRPKIDCSLPIYQILAPRRCLDLSGPNVDDLDRGDPRGSRPARLVPRNLRVVLQRGEQRTVDYELELYKDPTPLDVFFLIDVSGSMQDAIDGTARAMSRIVSELNAARINVWFGVGEYRSYTDEPAYRRLLEVSPPGEAVEHALESLIAMGGGDETQLEALYQAGTGAGRDGINGGELNLYIPPGQDARFREDSLRVILHATDEPFSEGPPHRSYEEVIDGLNANVVEQLGIAIQPTDESRQQVGPNPIGPNVSDGTPLYGLSRVARGTESFAPEGGVDCDGDGVADIAAGEELVCVIHPDRVEDASAMGPAIVNLLKALKDFNDIHFSITKGSKIAELDPKVIAADFKANSEIGFEVTFKCPHVSARKAFPVRIAATVPERDQILGTADATLVCRVPLPPEPEEPEPPLVPAVVPPPVILPPPPVPPEIAPNPQPNPQPNPAPQGQAQTQGALAQQRQEQPQLAYVYAQQARAAAAAQELGARREGQYAMSSYSRRSEGVPPEAMFIIGALTITCAFGCVTLSHERVRTQQARR